MDNAFLVAGLGNPGKEYQKTRHNAGFLLLEQWADQSKLSWGFENKFESALTRFQHKDSQVFLCRPATYMNASGRAIARVAEYLKIPIERMLVVVDDADLALGTIRMRPGGSSGGHHGLDSIEQHLGSREFARLRLGIGRNDPKRRQITGHVLGVFSNDEWPVFEKMLERARSQVQCWLDHGAAIAMNRFNGSVETAAKD